MKKILALALSVSMVSSLFLAGCSKTEEKKAGSPAATTAATKEEVKPAKLSIVWWGGQPRHDYTTQLLKTYSEKNPNVTFEPSYSAYTGYFDKLATQSAAGSLPDIIQMDYTFLETYSKFGTLSDLTQYVTDKTLDVSGIDKNLMDSGKQKDKLLGIPLSSLILGFNYDTDALKAAGITAPTNDWKWADFEKLCIEYTKKTGNFAVSAIARPQDANYFMYWVRQSGKTMYAADGTKLGYDDDKIFASYASMLLRLQKAKAMPTPDEWLQYAPKGDSGEPVAIGKGLSNLAWMNFPVVVAAANPKLMTMVPPNGDSSSKGLWIKPAMMFSVAKSSKGPKEAAAFINWFVNDIEANKVIKAERGVPVTDKVRAALKPLLTTQQQNMFDYSEAAAKYAAKIDPAEPIGVAEVLKAFNDSINQALYEKMSPDQAAADFRKKANEILARNAAK